VQLAAHRVGFVEDIYLQKGATGRAHQTKSPSRGRASCCIEHAIRQLVTWSNKPFNNTRSL
jgi:hypothetical protein